MSQPAVYNWEPNTQGDTFYAKLIGPVTNKAGPIDLSQARIRMHIRSPGRDKALLREFDSLSTDPTTKITIGGTDSNEFTIPEFSIDTPGSYAYSIELTINSFVRTWIEGVIKITGDATHDE